MEQLFILGKGKIDDIIKEVNSLYLELVKTNKECQRQYQARILEEKPYEHIIDKEVIIK